MDATYLPPKYANILISIKSEQSLIAAVFKKPSVLTVATRATQSALGSTLAIRPIVYYNGGVFSSLIRTSMQETND